MRNGIAGVLADRLARQLGTTRGSFYWHFGALADLHRALLKHWQETNTRPFEGVIADRDRDGRREYARLIDMWISEDEYSPAYDAAVRDWARISPAVASAVRKVDRRRIAIIRRIFEDLGFEGLEAEIRARITYFHQVGYYALGLGESGAVRRRLAPVYTRVLTGR